MKYLGILSESSNLKFFKSLVFERWRDLYGAMIHNHGGDLQNPKAFRQITFCMQAVPQTKAYKL